MGLRLIAKGANFDAINVGFAGLTTAITSGLVALHHLHRSEAAAEKNWKTSGVDGVMQGAPAFSLEGMRGNDTKNVQFAPAPANHGFTFASVFKVRPGTITDSLPAGSFPPSPGTPGGKGATYLKQSTTQISLESTSFPDGQAAPLSGSSTVAVALTKPTSDSWEMYAGQAESNVGVRLFHPRSGLSALYATPTRDYVYDGPAGFSSPVRATGYTSEDDVALFAYWSRVLTPEEINTFYGEMRSQLAQLLAI